MLIYSSLPAEVVLVCFAQTYTTNGGGPIPTTYVPVSTAIAPSADTSAALKKKIKVRKGDTRIDDSEHDETTAGNANGHSTQQQLATEGSSTIPSRKKQKGISNTLDTKAYKHKKPNQTIAMEEDGQLGVLIKEPPTYPSSRQITDMSEIIEQLPQLQADSADLPIPAGRLEEYARMKIPTFMDPMVIREKVCNNFAYY